MHQPCGHFNHHLLFHPRLLTPAPSVCLSLPHPPTPRRSKEKEEYEEAILSDITSLGVSYVRITHTSDYFDLIENEARRMIAGAWTPTRPVPASSPPVPASSPPAPCLPAYPLLDVALVACRSCFVPCSVLLLRL